MRYSLHFCAQFTDRISNKESFIEVTELVTKFLELGHETTNT